MILDTRLIKSESELAQFAQAFSSTLKRGTALYLDGPLGAGKTTFVRSLVQSLGADPRDVSSPTYTLQHLYPLPGRGHIEHWDLYRLSDLPLELREAPRSSDIRIIEWASRFSAELPPPNFEVEISFVDGAGPDSRSIALRTR